MNMDGACLAHAYLEKVASRLAQEGVDARTEVKTGNPAALLSEEGAKQPGTLIALTTHGRSGVGRWLMGSVADKVVRSGAAPVLLLRPG